MAVDSRPSGSLLDRLNRRAIQQRLEGSLLGQAVISALVTVVVLVGVVSSLPDSAIKKAFEPTMDTIASATGLDQNWHLFAPNPYRDLETFEVRVAMADGTSRVWTVPHGGPVTGYFTSSYWRKLAQAAVTIPRTRPNIAHWVVGKLTRPTERATRVRMVIRAVSLPPPGQSGPRNTTEQMIYDEDLTVH